MTPEPTERPLAAEQVLLPRYEPGTRLERQRKEV
jgi:hypothetical protein